MENKINYNEALTVFENIFDNLLTWHIRHEGIPSAWDQDFAIVNNALLEAMRFRKAVEDLRDEYIISLKQAEEAGVDGEGSAWYYRNALKEIQKVLSGVKE